MTKSKISVTYLILSFILTLGLFLYGASQLLAYFESGADLKSILIIDTESVNDYYQPAVLWQYPIRNEGRKIENNTLEKITKNYVASYFYLYQAYKSGDTTGLHDYFTKKSRDHVQDLVRSLGTFGQSVRGTTISHNVRLDFYSADGAIATLTDKMLSYEEHYYGDEIIVRRYDTSQYRVMLLLEDNFWRIRHKVKVDHEITASSSPDTDITPQVRVVDNEFYLHDEPFFIRGINYYPQFSPWEAMWDNFEALNLEDDFSRIRMAGFNTIRIFVPFSGFGGAEVKKAFKDRLVELMDKAEAAGLQVIVTLFDFFLGYPVEEWTLSDRHAESIAKALKYHPALLAWDLKNEPDLDFERSGLAEVLAWLRFVIRRMKEYDPGTPVTIGWSQPEVSVHLEELVDFVSLHFYREPGELEAYLSDNPINKPVFLGETGSHNFDRWWYPWSRDEQDQKAYYVQILKIIEKYRLNYGLWTLYDFTYIPPNVAGTFPWERGPQKAYGIIDSDGSTKACYELIKNFNLGLEHEKEP